MLFKIFEKFYRLVLITFAIKMLPRVNEISFVHHSVLQSFMVKQRRILRFDEL